MPPTGEKQIIKQSRSVRHINSRTFMLKNQRVETPSICITELAFDVRVSTLRQCLEALGARLELVAVFDDENLRVPVHLGRDTAA
jgi:hypothetical protein